MANILANILNNSVNTNQQVQGLTLPGLSPQTVLPLAFAGGITIAAKELEEERKKNEVEIKKAEANLATLEIPSDFAAAGLTREDCLRELHNTAPGIKSAGSSVSAALRGATISRETLEQLLKQKGGNIKQEQSTTASQTSKPPVT